jgi:hypothetical protein
MAKIPDNRPPARADGAVVIRVLHVGNAAQDAIPPWGIDPDRVAWGPQGAVLSGQQLGGADRTLRLRLVALEDGCGSAW